MPLSQRTRPGRKLPTGVEGAAEEEAEGEVVVEEEEAEAEDGASDRRSENATLLSMFLDGVAFLVVTTFKSFPGPSARRRTIQCGV